MQLLTILTQLIGHIAWPASVFRLTIMFRREIRQRLTAVTEVKYPGGSIIMRDVQRLEAKLEEVSVPRSVLQLPAESATGALRSPHSDARLAIAQMRLSVEQELFLISRHALHRGDVANWGVERRLDELEKANALPAALADSLREFIAVANGIVHGVDVREDVSQRATAIGSSLVATLRHRRLVLEAERDFEGHGLWHMHRKGKENTGKHYFWSAVAASMPVFDFDFDIYREAIQVYNSKAGTSHPGDAIYVLSLEEFVTVLEYREVEVLRLIAAWTSGKGWDKEDRVLEWRWPAEWGDLEWTSHILHERVPRRSPRNRRESRRRGRRARSTSSVSGDRSATGPFASVPSRMRAGPRS